MAVTDIRRAAIRHTSGFHPLANGQAERTNQTLRQHLRNVAKRSSDWVAALETAKISINDTDILHFPSLKTCPGCHPCLLSDTHWDTKDNDLKDHAGDIVVKYMQYG